MCVVPMPVVSATGVAALVVALAWSTDFTFAPTASRCCTAISIPALYPTKYGPRSGTLTLDRAWSAAKKRGKEFGLQKVYCNTHWSHRWQYTGAT